MLFFIQLLPAWSCIQVARSKVTEPRIPHCSTELAKCREQGGDIHGITRGTREEKRLLIFKTDLSTHEWHCFNTSDIKFLMMLMS